MSVCVIGVIAHIEQAKALNVEALSIDDLKKFNKEPKLIKKWARKFDVLLVSESLSRNVTKLIGRHVTSIGKLPVPISEKETVEEKFNELLCTIRLRVKKNPWLAQSVGVDTLDVEQIRQNVNKSINFLVSLLPKGWQNIRSITVKTTMGKPQKIY